MYTAFCLIVAGFWIITAIGAHRHKRNLLTVYIEPFYLQTEYLEKYHFIEPIKRKKPINSKKLVPLSEKKYLTKVPTKTLNDKELASYFLKDLHQLKDKIHKADWARERDQAVEDFAPLFVERIRKLRKDGLID